jgi:3-deoxy-D-manno-octulosonic-acid transferase
MIWLYRLLFPLGLLVTAPHYLLRMRRRGGYGQGFSERFGRLRPLPPRRPGIRRVWLQAVSVGEVLAVEPIVRALKAEEVEVVLTTTTSTGRSLALDRLSPFVLAIAYFPIDWWPFSRSAWEAIRPDLAVLTEGERWPEHLAQASRRGLPLVAINARISDRSFGRMRRLPGAFALVLAGISRLLAASEEDAGRFRVLGVPGGRIQVTGNIKMDVQIPLLSDAAKAGLRRELGIPEAGLVLLGSSTWPGEEEALLAALRRARGEGTACTLLLVPRHAERRAEVERSVAASGLRYHLRSRGPAQREVDIAVGDTTGELRSMTQLADLVFVGKSLPPHTEGQTPVEAAVLGKPILFGPGMSNFRQIERDLLARGCALSVPGPAELADLAAGLLRDPDRRSALSGSLAAWSQANRGGVGRTLEAIRDELSRFQGP